MGGGGGGGRGGSQLTQLSEAMALDQFQPWNFKGTPT